MDSYEGKAEKFRSLITAQRSVVRKTSFCYPILPSFPAPPLPLLFSSSLTLPVLSCQYPYSFPLLSHSQASPVSIPTLFLFSHTPRPLLSVSLLWCSRWCPVCSCSVSASPSLSLPTSLRQCTTCEGHAEQLPFLRLMYRVEWRCVHQPRVGGGGGGWVQVERRAE